MRALPVELVRFALSASLCGDIMGGAVLFERTELTDSALDVRDSIPPTVLASRHAGALSAEPVRCVARSTKWTAWKFLAMCCHGLW